VSSGILRKLNFGNKLVASVSTLTGLHICSMALSFARNLVIAKLVGAHELGVAAGYSAILAAVEACAEMGLKNAVVQNRNGGSNAFLGTVHAIALVRSVILALLLLLSADWVAEWFQVPDEALYFRLVALAPLIRGLWHHGVMVEQRSLRFTKQAALELWGQVVALGVGIGVAWATHSHVAIFAAAITHVSIMSLASHLLAPTRYQLAWDREIAREIKRFSAPLIFAGVLLFIGNQADRFIVGRAFDPTLLGQYSLAVMLTQVPTLGLARVFKSVFLPLLSHARDDAEFRRRRQTGQIGLLGLSAATLFFYIAFAPWIIRKLYGQEFTIASDIIGWLGVVAAIKILQFLPTQIAMSRSRNGIIAKTNLTRSLAIVPQAVIAFSTRSLELFILVLILSELLTLIYASHMSAALTSSNTTTPDLAKPTV